MANQHSKHHQDAIESLLFGHFARTGQRLFGDAAVRFVEQKFNPNHDLQDGRFTSGAGGGSQPSRPRTFLSSGAVVRTNSQPIANADPIGAIIRDRQRTQHANPKQPESAVSASRGSILTVWPIAGATVASLNRADKPGESPIQKFLN